MRTRSILFVLLALAGCDDADPKADGPLPGQVGNFESDLPASAGNGGAKGESTSRDDLAGAVPASANPNSIADNDASGADRAIVEADVVQLDGDRLYTLSRVAGLTVIDAADPARLRVLGRYRELNGTPFEMYLQNGVVLAMYRGWGQYVKSGDNYVYVQTSKVVALDVHDPSAIANVGSFDVAGDVSDSRIVGSVLYVVGYQNGYCWSCAEKQPRTSVLSLNVANPRAPQKIDELLFNETENMWGWNQRSVTVTDKRMYVAGPEYGQNGPSGSSIQVVDISDPGGDLVEAAVVRAAGQISSRWQMDEYQGVLRVVSQFPSWWREPGDHSPRVQTFRIDSSQQLVALGDTALEIPANETLQAARFDGPRGYAITAQRTDPLFTIDLSDPARPKQMGELVMPGWIYHMEPRGDRVIGLGYDQNNPAGAITVSVFDVSDLSTPKMLDRVNFGGTWATLPEDQDRIHKAFRVLAEQNLVLVPFSGWSSREPNKTECPYYYDAGGYSSGVQLVDLLGDDLVLRGAAPSRGEARRAVLRGQNLLAVSDEAVDSFDLTNRDTPKALSHLDLARNVTQAPLLANGAVARVVQDWYAKEDGTSIELVALADVERPELRISQIDLRAQLDSGGSCNSPGYVEGVYARGNLVHVAYRRWNYVPNRGNSTNTWGLVTVDASDPAQPKVVSNFNETEPEASSYWDSYYYFSDYGYSPNAATSVLTDKALVTLQQRSEYDGNRSKVSSRLRVLDLTDPANPRSTLVPLDGNVSYSGLIADGADVLFSHYETSRVGKARFYIDRLDLSAQPKLAAKVNVPGSLLHYDRAHTRALTSQLNRIEVAGVSPEACYARFAYSIFDYPRNWDGSTAI
ncbi:MAG TPA: beta-propeller domain-containing protein, partial [Polyangiales bacterium]|nr:beta-propeller domain-containing protein [Polyangiales bacterium]